MRLLTLFLLFWVQGQTFAQSFAQSFAKADCGLCLANPISGFEGLSALAQDTYAISQYSLFPTLPNSLWLSAQTTSEMQSLGRFYEGIRATDPCTTSFNPKVRFEWLGMNLGYKKPYVDPTAIYGNGKNEKKIEPVGSWLYSNKKREWMKSASFDEFSKLYPEKYSMKVEYAMGKILAEDSWASALQSLRNIKSELTESEQLQVLQRLGADFYLSYDSDRLDDSNPRSKGAVQSEQIFETFLAKHVQFKGASDAGVCRDIATAQAEAAITLGFKNVYIIGYKASKLAGHASVYLEGQEKGKSYRVNRSALQVQTGLFGGMALQQLDQGSPDLSIRHFVADTSGRPQTSVLDHDQSMRILGLMNEKTVESISPGYVARGGLAAADIQFSKDLHGRMYLGTNGFGQEMMGMGVVYNQSEYELKKAGFSNQIGASLSKTEQTDASSFDLLGVYQASLNSPKVSIDPKFQVKAQAYMETTAQLIYQVTQPDLNYLSATGDLNLRTGVRFNQGDSFSKISSNLDVSATFIPALGDFRDKTSVGPVLDHATIQARTQVRLNAENQARAYGLATAIIDSYGGVGIAELGYQDESFKGYVNYRGRLDTDSPLFRESAAKEWTVGLQKSWGQAGQDWLRLEYSRLEKGLGPDGPQFRLKGQYTID